MQASGGKEALQSRRTVYRPFVGGTYLGVGERFHEYRVAKIHVPSLLHPSLISEVLNRL